MKFISFAILLVFFASCSDMKKGQQLEEISNLQTTLDSLQNLWNEEAFVHTDSLSTVCQIMIDSIGTVYKNQELEVKTASKLDLFKQCHNDLKELKEIQEFYPVVLKEKKQSLSSLKKDVSIGSGRREKYEEYIAFEKKEMSTILQQYNDYQKTKSDCEKKYAHSHASVHQLLKTLNQNQQNKELLTQ
jgi:hypothetical protein